MTPGQKRDALNWAQQQVKRVSFDIPDRKPNEGPATEKQKDYIRGLARHIDEHTLQSLGKWQASDLIQQIINEQDIYTDEKLAEYLAKKQNSTSYSWCYWAILIAVLVAAVIYFARR